MNTHSAVLQETMDLQQASLESIHRMRHLASESKCHAGTALGNLNEQGQKLRKLEASTLKHKNALEKASKQQDKFARAKLHFGTKNKAKRKVKKERKLDDQINAVMSGTKPAPTFKRKGPRPKKTLTEEEDPSREGLFSTHRAAKEKTNTENRDRQELFSNRLDRTKSIAKTPQGAREAPLTAQDKDALDRIQQTDDILEDCLAPLEDNVSDLLAQAKLMGTMVEDHNDQLGRIHETIETSNWKTKVLQNRLARLSKPKPSKKHSNSKRGAALRSVFPI